MPKRIIEIGTGGSYLKFKNHQLILERNDEEPVSVPIEDLAAIILDTPQSTITSFALRELAKANVTVLCSDESHQPVGIFLATEGHSLQGERFFAQAEMKAPIKKRLWKSVIRSKLQVQAKVLSDVSGSDMGIGKMVSRVRSGDPENIEAQAAKRYWSKFFDSDAFKRDRAEEDQNRYLNYGYAVLRSLMARSIVATGLHPSLGIHHKNKYNAYALADDLMEPYRPFIDLMCWEVVRDFGEQAEMDKEVRKTILRFVGLNVVVDAEQLSMQGAIRKTAQSLSAVVMNKQRELSLPSV